MRIAIAFLALVGSGQSLANPALIATDRFPYRSTGAVVVDGGVMIGAPTALPTGLARGVGAGFAHGDELTWGVRVAWVTATEATMAWDVTHSDLRLRATGGMQRGLGRGTLGLRFGLGGTIVHESRRRHQGDRVGLTGDDLGTSTWAALPAADLDVVVALHVVGPWLVTVSGGPSIAYDDDPIASWSALVGVGWQP